MMIMDDEMLLMTMLIKKCLTAGDVVDREEALLSVLQLTHPPVVVVAVQHFDDVIFQEGQLVRALPLIVVESSDLAVTTGSAGQ